VTFNLEEMTIEEKLQVMEMLWDNICWVAPDFSSPFWHEEVLQEREQGLRDGNDKFVDWEAAKKNIRNRLP
jgi:hypothetical protein